jgi:hypothetical protein
VNDNEADASGFVELCERLKIKVVDFSRDMHDAKPFSEYTVGIIAKMLSELQKLGINASLSGNVFSATPGDQSRIDGRLAELNASSPVAAGRPLAGGHDE